MILLASHLVSDPSRARDLRSGLDLPYRRGLCQCRGSRPRHSCTLHPRLRVVAPDLSYHTNRRALPPGNRFQSGRETEPRPNALSREGHLPNGVAPGGSSVAQARPEGGECTVIRQYQLCPCPATFLGGCRAGTRPTAAAEIALRGHPNSPPWGRKFVASLPPLHCGLFRNSAPLPLLRTFTEFRGYRLWKPLRYARNIPSLTEVTEQNFLYAASLLGRRVSVHTCFLSSIASSLRRTLGSSAARICL